MRVRIATGEHEGAVGQLLGYGSDVGIVVLDGATDAVEIPTEQLEQVNDRWSGRDVSAPWWDGTGDAETSCAEPGWDDVLDIHTLCTRPDGHAGRHMMALTDREVAEVICAWPGTAEPDEADLDDGEGR